MIEVVIHFDASRRRVYACCELDSYLAIGGCVHSECNSPIGMVKNGLHAPFVIWGQLIASPLLSCSCSVGLSRTVGVRLKVAMYCSAVIRSA